MVNQHIGNHGQGIFCVDGFDLGSLLQGQMWMVLEVWDGKPTYRKQTLFFCDLDL